MKITEILLEYTDVELANIFGNKLVAKAKTDQTAPTPIVADKLATKIVAMDPTPNHKMAFWLVLNYANNRIARWEDMGSRAVPAIEKFGRLLNKPNLTPPLPTRDINQIKGLPALETILKQYPDAEAMTNSEISAEEEQNFYTSGQAILLFNNNQVKVVIPKTEAASNWFGKGTMWCTAAKNDNQFNYYNKKGPLYIVMIKGTNEKYQFHWATKQFMNAQDKEINPVKLANKYPILWDIFDPVARQNQSLILYKNPTEADQLAAVKKNGLAIQYIIKAKIKPSEAVQLAAVQQNGWAIEYIIKGKITPSEAVQLAAVQQSGYAIEYIIKGKITPSEAVQMAAAQQNGWAIEYIVDANIKPSEAVQLAAVPQDGAVIKYIIKGKITPSEAVQLAAVKKDWRAIKYITNAKIKPSEAVQLAAVKQDESAIEHIINANIKPSEAVQLAAVQQSEWAIRYITNAKIKPSEAVQLAAVKQNWWTIKYITNAKIKPSEAVQLAAVQQDGRAIEYIQNPSNLVQAYHALLWEVQ